MKVHYTHIEIENNTGKTLQQLFDFPKDFINKFLIAIFLNQQ